MQTEKYYGLIKIQSSPSFTSIDPLWEKYYAWTPYQYSANNPVMFLDRNGESLYLAAADASFQRKAETVMNDASGGFYSTTIALDGEVTMVSTGMHGPQTPNQEVFNNTLLEASNKDAKDVRIYVEESTKIRIGSYDHEKIDIQDMIRIGNGKYISTASTFAHEIAEQVSKQRHGMKFSPAHNYAVGVEALMTGHRVVGINNVGDEEQKFRGNYQMHVDFDIGGGKTRKVIIGISNRNVVWIRR